MYILLHLQLIVPKYTLCYIVYYLCSYLWNVLNGELWPSPFVFCKTHS